MFQSRRHGLPRPISLAAGAVMLVAACGASAQPSTVTTPVSTPSAGPTVAATLAPTQGSTPSPVAADLVVRVSSTGERSKMLVGKDGRTLYTNSKDPTAGTTCVDACATTWPPLTIQPGDTMATGPGVPGTLGSFARPDGTMQVTYNGKALYYYSKDQPCKTSDSACGDVFGQAVDNIWYAATP